MRAAPVLFLAPIRGYPRPFFSCRRLERWSLWRARFATLRAGQTVFAKLAKRQFKRGVFPSVVALQETIHRFVAAHNREPQPFVWKADPKAIIAAAKRGYQALDSIH